MRPMGKRIFIIMVLLGGICSSQPASAQFTLRDAQLYAVERNKYLQAKNLVVKKIESELFNAGLLTPFNPELEIEKDSDILTARSGEGSLQLSLNQEFELGAQRGKRLDIARARIEEASLEALTFRERLMIDVRYAHSTLIAAQKKVENAKYAEDLAKSLRDTAYVRYRNSFIPFSEYTFLNIDYILMAKARSEAEVSLTNAASQFGILLGSPEDQFIGASGALSITPLSVSNEALLALALKSRYEISGSNLSRKISDLELALAKRDRIPNLKLSAFYLRDISVFNRDNLTGSVPGFEKLSDTDNLFGLRVTIPLPLINRHRSEITGLKLQGELIDTLLQGLTQRIKFEVLTSYQNLSRAEDNLRLFEGVLPDADSVLYLLQAAYSEGRIKLDDYLFQKDRLLSIRADFVDAYLEYAGARRALEQAVGLEWDSIR